MSTETWTWDGVSMSNYVGGSKIWDVRTWQGLDNIVGVNISGSSSGASSGTNGMFQLAQTHGEFWFPQFFTANTKLMTLHVTTNNMSTGAAGGSIDGMRQNLDQNLDYLTQLWQRRRNLANVVRNRSDGTSRLALVSVDSVIVPELVPITDYLVTVELTMPDPFWRDATDAALAIGIAPAFSGVVTGLAAATAPMQDLQFNITGPATNPRITDNESGSWCQYTGSVAAGKTLVMHNTNMTVDDGGSGWTPALSNMSHAGDSNWLTLNPSIPLGGVSVAFSASGTSGATALEIYGHKKYMR
jgi:hypothetical protein